MWLLDGRRGVKGPLGLAEHVSISLWTSFSEKCPEENASKTKEVTLRAVSSRVPMSGLRTSGGRQASTRAASCHISCQNSTG